MSAYTPREGSVAQRVMWFLEENGPSSTTTLCDDIEEVQRQSLVGCLATAVTHKAIYTEKREGENWYSLKPFAAQETDTPREGLQHVVKAEPGRATPADATDRTPTHATPAKAGTRVEPPSPATVEREGGKAAKVVELTEQLPTRKPRTFACGLFSDGRLVLELAGGTDVVLQRGETLELVRFLDRTLTTGELAS